MITLDTEIEMEDVYSGLAMSYADLTGYCDVTEIDESGVEVIDEDVDPTDVLEEEIARRQANISWNTDALEKHKAFLESLLNEDDDEQAVAS